MAVKVRLARQGAKKRPFYRVVVTDSRNPRDGRFIEHIGFYDPTREPAVFELKGERWDHWVKNGATPTDTIRRLVLKHQKGASASA